MKKVLVAGATGYLGGYVVKELKKQGYAVRALTRTPSRLATLREHVDEEYIGQVTEPFSLVDLCKDIDIVISSIGITRQHDGLTYRDVDYQGNLNLLQNALQHKVKKFIYVSAFGVEKMPQVKVVAAKQAVVRKLRESGINYTVVYPNGFFSDMLEVLNRVRKGRGYVFGSGEYRLNPIHGADLAEFCVDVIESAETDIEVGGPDILTQKQIYTLAFRAINKAPKITSIPIWVRNVVLWILRSFTSAKFYGPFEFFLTAMTMDVVAPTYGKRHLKDFYLEKKNSR